MLLWQLLPSSYNAPKVSIALQIKLSMSLSIDATSLNSNANRGSTSPKITDIIRFVKRRMSDSRYQVKSR